MQPGTAMCFLNFHTLVFWTPLVQRISTMMQTQDHNVKNAKEGIEKRKQDNFILQLQNVQCDHLDLQKFYVPFIWKRKTFTEIDMNPFIYTLTNSFCTNFHNTRLSTMAILVKFPPYCFFAKIIPRLHSSYMFHQSCAFCFVLILPLAQSGKYSYITSLKL